MPTYIQFTGKEGFENESLCGSPGGEIGVCMEDSIVNFTAADIKF
jgi:hypothetical protein